MSNELSNISKNRFKILFGINILIGFALIFAYINTHVSPNTIPYISYLGLAYPFLLLIIFLFSLFWIFYNKKYIVFNLIIFLSGWNHFSDFFAFNNSKTIHSTADVKLISYNVQIFNYYNESKRIETRNNIFKFLEEQKADVYCFQEFYHQEGIENFKTRDTLINLLNTQYYHERYTHEMTGKRFFGLATFSKYPIINKGGIKFLNDVNNYCIYSDIVKNGDTIRFFNAHLGSIRLPPIGFNLFKNKKETHSIVQNKPIEDVMIRIKSAFEKRAIQVEMVLDEVEKSPYKTVLCGDFNDTPISYCYNRIENELLDAFTENSNGIGSTYIGNIPFNRIDYIFYSNQLMSKEFNTHNIEFSDHRPISCYIGNVID